MAASSPAFMSVFHSHKREKKGSKGRFHLSFKAINDQDIRDHTLMVWRLQNGALVHAFSVRSNMELPLLREKERVGVAHWTPVPAAGVQLAHAATVQALPSPLYKHSLTLSERIRHLSTCLLICLFIHSTNIYIYNIWSKLSTRWNARSRMNQDGEKRSHSLQAYCWGCFQWNQGTVEWMRLLLTAQAQTNHASQLLLK